MHRKVQLVSMLALAGVLLLASNAHADAIDGTGVAPTASECRSADPTS